MRIVLEILGALLVFYAIKRWADRRRLSESGGGGSAVGPRRRPGEVVVSSSATTVSSSQVLDALSPQQLAELSPKERAFVLDVLRGLEARGGNAEGVTITRIAHSTPSGARPGETAAGRAARSAGPPAPLAPPPPPDAVLPVRLYCPACGAPLVEAGHRLAEVTECHGCGRALAVRPDDDRLIVTLALGREGRAT